MTLTLDTARDLWAARYGYEERSYLVNAKGNCDDEIFMDPVWSEVMEKLRDNACLDINYTAGTMRLKEWKS